MVNLDFRQRLIAKFVLFGILIVSISSVILFELNKNATLDDLVNKSEIKFQERKRYLVDSVDQFKNFILSFEDSSIFLNNIKTNNVKDIERIFLDRLKSHEKILQIRYIDLNGNEKVRIDRIDSKPIVIEENKLQNKSKRYYFSEISKLEKGKIWYSKIDLNKEYGKIERPIKPVIRVGSSVYINGVKEGILIINISMKDILDNLSETTLYNVYLIDKDGYFILHKPNGYDSTDYSFSRYLNLNYKVHSHFKKEYENILNNDIYKSDRFYSRVLDVFYGERVKMILEVKQKMVEDTFDTFKGKLLSVLLISTVISIPFAYMVAQMVDKLREELELKLSGEKDKLREKEISLEKQSKMVQMGEMIGNIAHQWRQPLQSISGTAGSVKVQSELGLISNEEIQEYMEDIEDRTKYLSEVIDVFRNFIKDDKIVEIVIVQERIESALNIMSASIESKQIKLIQDIDYNDELEVRLTKGELVQVIINILNNSKDILLEKDIKDPWIKISLEKVAEKAIITIEDNGGGIPDDILPRIFEPYFTTKHQTEGTGLGLHMSHDIIVNSLGGEIYAQNTQNGAKFFIEINLNSDITKNNNGEDIGT